MAFVDLKRNRLIFKLVIAGPPEVGKTTRLEQVGESGSFHEFGTSAAGRCRMARLPLEGLKDGRLAELELYEWHGPERADIRAKGLFVGLDGLVYMPDAREDRFVDSCRTFTFLEERAGRSKIARLPALLALGRKDEGTLRLERFESKLLGPSWTHRVEAAFEDAEPFVETLRLYGEVVLTRTL
ncbi:MAG: hypothetical protein H6729_12485 [Deltaproteobacteria bacterium]|nr:hypothetical protein [Deltaproteobacteria bacterium]